MKCKIYAYQSGDTCDMVFEIKDFAVVCMEDFHDGDFWKIRFNSLEDYEDSLRVRFNKTYIGSVD